MSAQPAQPIPTPAPVLPDPKEAYDTLFRDVHARSFFGRLAQHGLYPQTEKQAQDMLSMAGVLRKIAQDPRVQAAEAANDPVAGALNHLNKWAQDNNFAKSAAHADIARKQAAISLAGNSAIYNAVLSIKAAQAQELQASLRGPQ